MAENPETCVRCGGTDVVPRGKIIHKGRKVTEVECKRCGIIFVSTKDLPVLDKDQLCCKSRLYVAKVPSV
jgi:transcription elongation factor Elf1